MTPLIYTHLDLLHPTDIVVVVVVAVVFLVVVATVVTKPAPSAKLTI